MGISYNPATVSNDLVLCLDAANTKSYPGSGTTWTDLSVSKNNATLTNSPTYESTNNGSLVFNGTTQYGSVPDITGVTDFSNTDNYTIDFWVYLNSTQNDVATNDNDIVEKWSGADGYPYVFRYIRASNEILVAVYNGTASAGTRITVTSNNWWHICGVFNWSTSTLTVYGNGGKVTSSTPLTLTGTITNSSVLALMRRGNNINYVTGKLSGLKIYNRALTAVEVEQNFNALRGRYGL